MTLERLDLLVRERLAGDKGRLLELFESREVFDLSKASGDPADWFHFEPQTFDGQYLVATAEGFQVYQQDRGARTVVQNFRSLRDAALAVFG